MYIYIICILFFATSLCVYVYVYMCLCHCGLAKPSAHVLSTLLHKGTRYTYTCIWSSSSCIYDQTLISFFLSRSLVISKKDTKKTRVCFCMCHVCLLWVRELGSAVHLSVRHVATRRDSSSNSSNNHIVVVVVFRTQCMCVVHVLRDVFVFYLSFLFCYQVKLTTEWRCWWWWGRRDSGLSLKT